MAMDVDAARRTLAQLWPDLAVQSIELEVTGERSDVFAVNGTLMLRFPRDEQGVVELVSEHSVLTAIAGRVSLPTPRPVRQLLDGIPGRAFIAYQRIPGEPF